VGRRIGFLCGIGQAQGRGVGGVWTLGGRRRGLEVAGACRAVRGLGGGWGRVDAWVRRLVGWGRRIVFHLLTLFLLLLTIEESSGSLVLRCKGRDERKLEGGSRRPRGDWEEGDQHQG